MKLPLCSALALALASGPAGCSNGARPYPVSGQVVYDDGKPATDLNGWDVAYTSAEMRVSSSGMIDKDGKYTLNYLKNGDGALAGTYKVTITPSGGNAVAGEEEDESDPSKVAKPKGKRKPTLSGKYSKADQTPLAATVEAKPNDITLTVARP